MDPRPGSRAEQYYRFTDEHGVVHITSSKDSLPPAMRERAELIQLDPAAVRAQHSLPAPAGAPRFELSWPSFGAGFASALLLVLTLRLMPRGMRMASRVALLAGLLAIGTGLYFGLLRRSTGASQNVMASPSALIDDARRAVDQVQQRRREQEAELRAIEKESR
jgi:hypothetical protein